MNIIVIDLEWNCPVVGKKSLKGLNGEIIQIGAAKIDENCNILDRFELMVKPQRYTKMNRYVEKLTGITNKDLETGLPLQEAAEQFKNWCGESPVFVSWGPDDIMMIRCNLDFFELDSSWLPVCYDAQLMFDDFEMQEDRQWPLNYALYHYNEKPDGAHTALADVLSTVLVLKHLDLSEGLSDDYFIVGSENSEDSAED